MVKFRMSMKSDKGEVKPSHISIPQKDAIAIVPPKKVIKALYDYQPPDPSPNSGYLAFTQGDFLHVVDRENDQDWYEACNPLQGTRGLVPVKYFDTVGKQARNSVGSAKSDPYSINAGHDSGYADNSSPSQSGDLRPMRMSKTLGGKGGAMVYGMVMYDFKAERPDELEAKEGEAIIVIAQSNPEWFVAKPITRLGGPGLIPVSFVEIRDMTTGQPVPDPQEAVARAGVPKVEEWKKMAADYKNGSIPLGKLDGAQNAMNQGMARMSLGQQSQASGQLGQNGQLQAGQMQQSQYMQRSQQLLAPLSAKVPRYCYADEIFWFLVEAQMEDGRHWCLQRVYQDFYDLQINLIQEYPVEAGNVKGNERTLPYMPGPVTYVTDNISNGRRANLDEYIRNLLKLGPHITKGYLVRKFFAPRQGDYEIDPEAADTYRLSSASQESPNGPSSGISPQSSAGNLSQGRSSAFSPASGYAQQQRGTPGPGPGPGHYRAGSSVAQSVAGGTAGAAGGAGGSMKIKVWFEPDNCVVIRMPAQFRYADLYRKLQERRELERLPDAGELDVSFRDEPDGGRLCPLRDDDDLAAAVARNPKLTLTVRVVAPAG